MSANLALEGPLRFSKKAEPITFLLSGKYSFIDKTGEYLNPKLKEQNLPFSFYDFIAKLSYKGKSGSKISTTGFHFNDKVKLSEDQLYEWSNYGIGLQAVILPPASAGLIRTELNFSNYSMNLSESFNNKRYSEVEDIKVGMEFMNHFANHELRMGVQVLGVHTDYYNENRFFPFEIAIFIFGMFSYQIFSKLLTRWIKVFIKPEIHFFVSFFNWPALFFSSIISLFRRKCFLDLLCNDFSVYLGSFSK